MNKDFYINYLIDSIGISHVDVSEIPFNLSEFKESIENLENIKYGLDNNQTIDMIEIDIKEIWNKLGEIIGESYSEELLDELFSKFCLGK